MFSRIREVMRFLASLSEIHLSTLVNVHKKVLMIHQHYSFSDEIYLAESDSVIQVCTG